MSGDVNVNMAALAALVGEEALCYIRSFTISFQGVAKAGIFDKVLAQVRENKCFSETQEPLIALLVIAFLDDPEKFEEAVETGRRRSER
ncbi:hypothetical protein HQ544_02450 [Candidatus Falkowbacteria bacterium]|nr:hypothetical protein [Candidatus Falkowbacteria bacterium]